MFCLFFVYGAFKRVNVFKTFCNGAYKSIDLSFNILPTLVTIFVLLALMSQAKIDVFLANLCAPILQIFGIDKNLAMLILLRPFSGSASLAMVESIYTTFGVDSYIGRCASVIMSSSDTLLYISALYLSKTKVKKLGYTLPLGFLIAIFSSIIACFVCKFI